MNILELDSIGFVIFFKFVVGELIDEFGILLDEVDDGIDKLCLCVIFLFLLILRGGLVVSIGFELSFGVGFFLWGFFIIVVVSVVEILEGIFC